jgi:hypothetical protein
MTAANDGGADTEREERIRGGCRGRKGLKNKGFLHIEKGYETK